MPFWWPSQVLKVSLRSLHSGFSVLQRCVSSSLSESRSVASDSVRPHGLQPTRLPCPWASPGKNTGVGCHALLQRIFPTQGSNLGLPCCLRFFTVWALSLSCSQLCISCCPPSLTSHMCSPAIGQGPVSNPRRLWGPLLRPLSSLVFVLPSPVASSALNERRSFLLSTTWLLSRTGL